MRLYEYQAKKLLQAEGIPIPLNQIIEDPKQIQIPFPVVLKAQIPAGGRKKAGGIVSSSDAQEAASQIENLRKLNLRGFQVNCILAEQKLPIAQEFFLAVTYDTAIKQPVALMSTEGGIDIEELAREKPHKIIQRYFNITKGLAEHTAREMVLQTGLKGNDLTRVADLLYRMAVLFLNIDATIVEINPLVKTTDGKFFAADCHIDIDDDALFRQKKYLEEIHNIPVKESAGKEATPFEKRAAEIDAQDYRGVAGRMIEFDGDMGLLIGGGGASLTSFDAIKKHGGRPANYCEIGGNPSVVKVKELTKHIFSKPGVEKIAVIMNVVSNTRVDLVARGVIKGIVEMGLNPAERIAIFRIPGSWEEEGFRILSRYGVNFCDRSVSIDEAARRAVAAFSH